MSLLGPTGGAAAVSYPTSRAAGIPYRRHLRTWRIAAAAIFLAGLATSLLMSGLMVNYVDHLRRQDARGETQMVASRLRLLRQENTDLLVALGAALSEHPEMLNADLRRWAASTRLFARHPALIAIGYSVLVPADSVTGFAATIPRANGDRRPFVIVPPGHRSAYCFIRAGTGRSDASRLPPGFDFCAGRESILATRDTGQADVVPIIRPGAQSLFSISIPVYKGRPPETVRQRRRRFVGWAGLSLNPQILLREATAAQPVVGVTVRYLSASGSRTLVSFGKQTSTVARAKLAERLVLTASVRNPALGIENNALGLAILVYGILLSVAMSLLVLRLARRHAGALEAVGEATEKLDFLAHHDPLTRLANRTLMIADLEDALDHARREAGNVGAIMVDLDGFKDINDTFGHQAGDRVLEVVAERLLTATRARDTVARVGGDEFVVVIGELPSDRYLETIAGRMTAAIREPIAIEHLAEPLRVTASVGVAHGPAESADLLLRRADDALYEAKARGKSGYVVAPT